MQQTLLRHVEELVHRSSRPTRRELWTHLTEYHLRQAQGPYWQRRESAFAVVAMAIDSIISIDDIDIADLYDD